MSLVYFMRRADGVGPVKIGCSKWPEHRLTALQVWSPEPLTIIASAKGGFSDEKRLHRQFAKYRLHAEWFEPVAEILAMAARIRTTGTLPAAPAADRVVQMTAMYEGGKTLEQIGSYFGITRERVRQILRKHDVPTKGPRSRAAWCPAAKARKTVVFLAAQGNTAREIAEAVGDNVANVWNVLRKAGLKPARGYRGPEADTVQLADEIAAEYRAGAKTGDIALRHGIQQPTIYRLLRVAGVSPSRNRRRAA